MRTTAEAGRRWVESFDFRLRLLFRRFLVVFLLPFFPPPLALFVDFLVVFLVVFFLRLVVFLFRVVVVVRVVAEVLLVVEVPLVLAR